MLHIKTHYHKLLCMRTTYLTRVAYLAVALLYPGYRVLANTFLNPIRSTSIEDLLNTIITVVIFILFPVIVLMLVYTGFLFVQAQGNPAKLNEARKAFIWTLVGAFVILAARTLQEVIVDTVESL